MVRRSAWRLATRALMRVASGSLCHDYSGSAPHFASHCHERAARCLSSRGLSARHLADSRAGAVVSELRRSSDLRVNEYQRNLISWAGFGVAHLRENLLSCLTPMCLLLCVIGYAVYPLPRRSHRFTRLLCGYATLRIFYPTGRLAHKRHGSYSQRVWNIRAQHKWVWNIRH